MLYLLFAESIPSSCSYPVVPLNGTDKPRPRTVQVVQRSSAVGFPISGVSMIHGMCYVPRARSGSSAPFPYFHPFESSEYSSVQFPLMVSQVSNGTDDDNTSCRAYNTGQWIWSFPRIICPTHGVFRNGSNNMFTDSFSVRVRH